MQVWVWSLEQEDLLEKQTATHSSILAREIPWTEEPGDYGLWGHKESDTTERLNNSNYSTVCIHQFSQLLLLLLLLSHQSCPTLCDPIDGSPPGSPVPGILQARLLECCHFLLQCRKVKSESEVAQSYPTLSNPMDCSLPGSSIHGIFQARALEWGAIAFSRE